MLACLQMSLNVLHLVGDETVAYFTSVARVLNSGLAVTDR